MFPVRAGGGEIDRATFLQRATVPAEMAFFHDEDVSIRIVGAVAQITPVL